jgi:hypothetical protein
MNELHMEDLIQRHHKSTNPHLWEGAFFVALNDAQPVGGHTTQGGENVPEFQDTSAFAHPLERTLLRVLTKGGNYAVGNQDWRQFAWNGRVFALGDQLDLDNLIQYEIAPAFKTNPFTGYPMIGDGPTDVGGNIV